MLNYRGHIWNDFITALLIYEYFKLVFLIMLEIESRSVHLKVDVVEIDYLDTTLWEFGCDYLTNNFEGYSHCCFRKKWKDT